MRTSTLAAMRASSPLRARPRRRRPRRPTRSRPSSSLAAFGILDPLEDVLVGDQPLEVELLVDDQDLLDLVLVEELLGLLERRPDGDGDELLGHDLFDGQVRPGLEADVPVGQDADQLVGSSVIGRPEIRYFCMTSLGLVDLVRGPHADGVVDHAALVALDLVHLLGLGFDRHVAVDDARCRPAGPGRWPSRLGDGVHGRADDGDVRRRCSG